MNFTAKSSLFAFMVLFASLLNAQTTPTNKRVESKPTTEATPEREDAELAKELNLNQAQNEQFKKINKDYKAKTKAAKKAKKEDMKKMRDERMAAHKALLTEDQARKYDEVMAKRAAKKTAKKSDKHEAKKAEKAGRKAAKSKDPKSATGQE